jgi:replicative DNA helicase
MYFYDGINLTPEDFYQKEHSFIYQAIKELWSSRRTIDVLTVADQLGKKDMLDTVGGTDYLYELSAFLMSTSSCPEYVKIVKEKSVLRNILKTSQKIMGDVYEQKDTMAILETIEKRVFDLTQDNMAEKVHSI